MTTLQKVTDTASQLHSAMEQTNKTAAPTSLKFDPGPDYGLRKST